MGHSDGGRATPVQVQPATLLCVDDEANILSALKRLQFVKHPIKGQAALMALERLAGAAPERGNVGTRVTTGS